MDNQSLKKINQNEKNIFLVIIGAFFVVLILFFGVSIQNKIKEGKYIGQEIESKNTISVSGTGEVYAKPDLAIINFAIENEAKTVAEAMSENTKKMNEIINSLKNEGIDEKDLKTLNFNIYPRYEWHDELITKDNSRRVLVGYEVSQSLQVKIRNMEQIGEIIREAANAGANQIGNLQFTIDNQDEFEKQAREKAINEATEKAKELASQLGIDLVRIVNFNESSSRPSIYNLAKSSYDIMSAGGIEEASQVETGENKIEMTVNITYEIN